MLSFLLHRSIQLAGLLLTAVMPLVLPSAVLAGEGALPVTGLNERTRFVQIVPGKGGGERIRMQYTVYLPDGPGPFPLVLVNHGTDSNPRMQPVDRPIVLAREMVARGYAVVAPMRRGFAGTQGRYQHNSCVEHRRIDVQGLGSSKDWSMTDEVFDLHAFINAIVGMPEIDRSRIVMVSQSGGFTSTLGYMTMPRSGALGYINFVGGGFSYCAGKVNLALASQSGMRLGQKVQRPGLWIYARQDSFVSAATYRVMFNSFVSAGGKASWVELNPPIEEGHYMLGEDKAVSTWWPHVEAFLQSLGLPTHVRYKIAESSR